MDFRFPMPKDVFSSPELFALFRLNVRMRHLNEANRGVANFYLNEFDSSIADFTKSIYDCLLQKRCMAIATSKVVRLS